MKVIKLYIKKGEKTEIRRFQVKDFQDFVSKVKNLASVGDLNELQMKYLDEENDWVTFSSEMEFNLINCEAVKVSVSLNSEQKEEKKEKPEFRHHIMRQLMNPNKHWNVICDVCGVEGFEGERWKCRDCPDYDLCGKCFKNKEKIHPEHQFWQMDPQRRWIVPKKEEMKKMEEKVGKFVGNLKDAFLNGEEVKKVEEKAEEFVKKVNKVLKDEKIEEKVGDFVKKVQEAFSGNVPCKKEEVTEKKQEVEKPVEKDEPKVQPKPEAKPEPEPEPVKEEKKFEGPYVQQMKLLSEMGFDDYKLMEHLLKHHKGNIQKVVELMTRM